LVSFPNNLINLVDWLFILYGLADFICKNICSSLM